MATGRKQVQFMLMNMVPMLIVGHAQDAEGTLLPIPGPVMYVEEDEIREI